MQFLSDLWNIQKWARTQTTYRLYSSSVLLVYDARRLKPVLQYQTKSLNSSSAKLNNSSGNLSGTSPAHSSGSSSRPSSPTQVVPVGTDSGVEPLQHYYKIQRSHSTMNNYEEVPIV